MTQHKLVYQGLTLLDFVCESQRIEGIVRDPTPEEINAHELFLALPSVTVGDLENFVDIIAPHAVLRRDPGMNVIVGRHVPPEGGPHIERHLALLLDDLPDWAKPWQLHARYETLHPFLDGNGRSGRVLWAWHLQALGRDPFALPILHAMYYEALQGSR